ncbi:acyltransferase family protein [Derxia lacustris]|uniref:acyltransferase family protein n=1 Tax=Derxia lacustris TaxID=764842 RepID=UPI000A177E71|nr:acyltransferase [Derxia lacustris]
MTAAGPVSRLDAIDGLRAVAMTMVIAQHCHLLPMGWIGVWIFFGISGYVISHSLYRNASGFAPLDAAAVGDFFWRRFVRIVPVYLLYVAINLPFMLAEGQAAQFGNLPWLLAFVFNWHMIFTFWPGPADWPAFGHLWTLSVEQQFYLLFPLLLMALAPRRRLAVFLLLAACGPALRWLYALAIADALPTPLERAFGVYAASVCQFDAFLLGASLRLMQERGWLTRRLSNAAWGLGLAGFAVYAASYLLVNRADGATGVDLLRNVVSGIMAGAGREVWVYSAIDLLVFALLAHLLLGRAGAGLLAARPVVAVGRVSYGGYLFHALVLHLVSRAWLAPADAGVALRLALFALVLGITLVLAQLSYRNFERPLARWLSTRRPTVTTGVADNAGA